MSTTTIARALTGLKHTDVNFNKTLEIATAVVCKDGKAINHDITAEEAKAELSKFKQSVLDSLESEFNARKAIAVSNFNTVIKIADKEMTIAEALLFKNHMLNRYKQIRNLLDSDIRKANQIYASELRNFESIVSNLLKDKDTEATESLKPYIDSLKPSVINMKDWLEELETYINNFEMELDAILSESNAITNIEV